jgi:hypothetical protein
MNTTDHLPEKEGLDALPDDLDAEAHRLRHEVYRAQDAARRFQMAARALRPVLEDTGLMVGEVAGGLAEVAELLGVSTWAAAAEVRHTMDCFGLDFHDAVGEIIHERVMTANDVCDECMAERPDHYLVEAVAPVLKRTGMTVAQAVEVLRSWADGEGDR